MMPEFKPKIEMLPAAQQRLWLELSDIPRAFVLYGGTAVALHLGHRISIDFDFFGTVEFDPDQLLETIPFLSKASVIQKSPNTLTAIVDRGGAVQVSFFGVPRLGRIEAPCVAETTNLQVAGMIDLAGTKAAVVQKRAEAKDYLDLDALIHQGFIQLSNALSAACVIYGRQFNPELTLKALCYFGDGNLSAVPLAAQRRLAAAVNAVDIDALPNLTNRSAPPPREETK